MMASPDEVRSLLAKSRHKLEAAKDLYKDKCSMMPFPEPITLYSMP